MTNRVVFLLLFTGLSSQLLAQPLTLSPQETTPLRLTTAPTLPLIAANNNAVLISSSNQHSNVAPHSRLSLIVLSALITLLFTLSCLRHRKRKAFLSQALASGQASHQQMQWLMAVLDSFPAMVLISDAVGKPLLANKAYNESCCHSFVDAGNSQSDECIIGDKYYRISREVVSHNDGHQYHITVFADFTELMQRKQELKLSQQQAVDALKARESFLGIISHELRTPLAAMIGLMELLKPELKSSQNQELLKNAQASAERLKALVNDILDFSKMEADQLQLDTLQGNIFDELGSMLRTLEAGARVKGLNFIVDWQPTKLCYAELDWLRLSQIVNNLVSNAIKFTQQGSIKVSVRHTEEWLFLTIEDSGCGMTPTQLDTLFQPFVQGDPSINRNYGGTGLGMSIVSHLVQLMGGEISLESQQSQGTHVYLSLPVKFLPLTALLPPEIKTTTPRLQNWLKLWGVSVNSANGTNSVTNSALEEVSLCSNLYPDLLLRALSWPDKRQLASTFKNPKYTGKVLVADDDPINRFLFQKQLKKLGLEVVTVNDGQEAFNYLMQTFADITLLITDCHMPKLNGYELVRKLRANNKFNALPIIGCTAEDSRLVAEKGASVGMNEIIYKPYSFDALSATLGRYCKQQVLEDGLDKLEWLDEYQIEEQLEFSAVVRDSLIADKAQLLEQTIPLAAIAHRIKGAANALNLNELAALAYVCQTVSDADAPLATKRLTDEIELIIAAINNWLSKQYL